MRIFRLIIIIVVSFFSSCSSTKKFESRKSKENFFKWFVDQQEADKIFYRTIDLSLESFWVFKDWGRLTKKDSLDIEHQIILNNGSSISPEIIGKKTIVKNEKEDYFKFSSPIFFDNNKKVWIYMQLWSTGKLGFESIEVWQTTNDGYKRLFETSVLNTGDVE